MAGSGLWQGATSPGDSLAVQLRTFLTTVVLACLALPAARALSPPQEEEVSWRGPIRLRSAFPLDLLSLDMTPDDGGLLVRGAWSVDVHVLQSNTFELTSGFDAVVADHENGLSEPNWGFVMDGELTRTSIDLAVGISKRLEVGLDLPLLSYGGGFLDSLIDSTHETFGLPGNDRHLRGDDELDLDIIAGQERFRLQDGDFGLGDLTFRAKVGLLSTDSFRLAASVEVKVPTGDEDKFHGSGSTDYGLSFFLSTGGRRHFFHAGLGYYFLGDTKALPFELEDRGSLLVAYEFQPTPNWGIVSQLVLSSSALPDNPQLENDGSRLELSIGFEHGRGSFRWGAGFVENITTHDNTADLGLFLFLRWLR